MNFPHTVTKHRRRVLQQPTSFFEASTASLWMEHTKHLFFFIRGSSAAVCFVAKNIHFRSFFSLTSSSLFRWMCGLCTIINKKISSIVAVFIFKRFSTINRKKTRRLCEKRREMILVLSRNETLSCFLFSFSAARRCVFLSWLFKYLFVIVFWLFPRKTFSSSPAALSSSKRASKSAPHSITCWFDWVACVDACMHQVEECEKW